MKQCQLFTDLSLACADGFAHRFFYRFLNLPGALVFQPGQFFLTETLEQLFSLSPATEPDHGQPEKGHRRYNFNGDLLKKKDDDDDKHSKEKDGDIQVPSGRARSILCPLDGKTFILFILALGRLICLHFITSSTHQARRFGIPL